MELGLDIGLSWVVSGEMLTSQGCTVKGEVYTMQ